MAIGSIDPSGAAAVNGMGMQDFMRILLAQLTYQDPLKPMDNQQFMAQMAQFTALEQTQQLNDRLSTLISNHAALQSVGLIGREVDIKSGSSTLAGIVTALSLAGDATTLSVKTADGKVVAGLPLTQLLAIR